MGEKASIFQTVQIGVESSPGTAVAANKKLMATSLVPSIKTDSKVFTPQGNKYPTFAVLNKEWSEYKIEGDITYTDIVYLLSSLISAPTPVQQGGTAAYKWTFTSNSASEDTAKTFTVEQGDANTAWRSAGVRVSGLSLSFSREETKLSGDAVGLALETGITKTSSPSEIAAKVVLPTQLKLYMADTQSGLSSPTEITRGFALEWSLTDKSKLIWPIGQNPVAIESTPKIGATLSVATDTVGVGFITTMRNGATKWFRIKATGDLIASTYYYTVQIDFPAMISDVTDFGDSDGIYVVKYALQGVHDSTWGKSFQVDITTTLTAL